MPRVVAVHAFVERLAELPCETWLSIGEALMLRETDVSPRAAALSRLQHVLDEHHLLVRAWQVRDAVETAAWLVSHRHRHWSHRDRCAFAATHSAASAAALALLARARLQPGDLATLTAPFESPPPKPQVPARFGTPSAVLLITQL